jgi:hypothetical protein
VAREGIPQTDDLAGREIVTEEMGSREQLPQTSLLETSKGAKLLEFFTRHFAAISAIVVLLGVFNATVFLFAFLRVFDWRLIWMVEYADILKIGLVAVGVLRRL